MHTGVLDLKIPAESSNRGRWPSLERFEDGFRMEEVFKQKLKGAQSAPPGQRLYGKD